MHAFPAERTKRSFGFVPKMGETYGQMVINHEMEWGTVYWDKSTRQRHTHPIMFGTLRYPASVIGATFLFPQCWRNHAKPWVSLLKTARTISFPSKNRSISVPPMVFPPWPPPALPVPAVALGPTPQATTIVWWLIAEGHHLVDLKKLGDNHANLRQVGMVGGQFSSKVVRLPGNHGDNWWIRCSSHLSRRSALRIKPCKHYTAPPQHSSTNHQIDITTGTIP